MSQAATVEDLRSLERLIGALPEQDRKKLQGLAAAELRKPWLPNPGPQTAALECQADELFYGGEAGGGKTSLLVGASLTRHRKSLILRRTNVEANKLVEEFAETLGSREGWNGQDNIWRLPIGNRIIDIRGCQHEDDKQKFKGAPHDLIGLDEISDFSETQYRFIIGWNRSTDPSQRCRVIATGNPPTTPEGLWVLKYWGAWVDETHPRPAKQGELRWYTTIKGEDTEVDGPGPYIVDGRQITARSRTFIRAKLSDNPDLDETGYGSVLAALPEELRAAYYEGSFSASHRDHEWQVIPTAWIKAAQERWRVDGWKNLRMTALGCDVAQGGADQTTISTRYGTWFAPLESRPGSETPDPPSVAGLITMKRRDGAVIVVDVGGGYGGGVVSYLKDNETPVTGFNGAHSSIKRTQDGQLGFVNMRAEAHWRLREALDPGQEGGSPLALPPMDATLVADLAAPRWKLTPRGILIESKDDIKKRIGRSPDRGDSVVMCWSEGQALAEKKMRGVFSNSTPKVNVGHAKLKRRR